MRKGQSLNKQELIAKYENELKNVQLKFGANFKTKVYEELLNDLKQLDEPQEPVVPQFVADWIEECKNDDFHLFGAMETISSNRKKLDYWFREDDNMELFARAWLDGYEIEKQYEVILCNGQSLKTVYRQGMDRLDFEKEYGDLERFTRKQLEEANFGWVFDCEGIEVREVE